MDGKNFLKRTETGDETLVAHVNVETKGVYGMGSFWLFSPSGEDDV